MWKCEGKPTPPKTTFLCCFGIFHFLFVICAIPFSYSDLWIIDSEENPNLPEVKNELLFISLGSHCLPAGLLRESALRQAAFPFDWIISLDNDGIVKAIQDNFLEFLNEYYLIPDHFLLENASGANLIHMRYHFEFVHEGNFQGSESRKNMEGLKQRYQRRIERFRKLSQYTGTVVFLRCCYSSGLIDNHRYFKCAEILDISDEDSLKLYWALRTRFPRLKMKLIIMNEGNLSQHGIWIDKWLNENVLKVRYYFATESEMHSEYRQFFYSLGSREDFLR